MSLSRNVTHQVRGYAGPKHPRVPAGELLVSTWHVGTGSKDTEVLVWKARIKRGDASRCEVYDYKTGETIVIEDGR